MSETLRVLYVDDEPDLLELGKLFLEQTGDFSVATIISVPAAFEILKLEQFDAIISDFQMPEMDGLQFLIEVRIRFGRIPFILFTGKGREEIVIQAINEGADFYLQKGGESKSQFTELAHKIRSAVSRQRTEDALRESELFLKKTQQIARLGGWKANPHTDYLEWTDGIYDIIEAPRNYRPGLTEGMKYYAPEDIQVIREKVTACLLTGEPFAIEARIITETGKRVWTEVRGLAPVTGGARSYVVGTLQDIADRKIVDDELRASYEQISANEEELRQNLDELKRQERALLERETQLRAILDSTADGILAVNNNGKVLLASRRLAQVLKIPQSIMNLGDDQALLDLALHQLTDPDTFLKKIQLLRDSDAVDSDSLTFNDDRVIERYSFPMIMDGERIGRVWSFRDITSQRLAEAALRESELLFREVFNNANDAVFLLERTPEGPGKYLIVNDRAVQMLGYSKEEFLEMSPRDIVPEDIQKKIIPDVIKKLRIDGNATFESAHRRKNGSIYPIEVSTHTFRYKGKDVDLSIIRDITERKQAEKALEHHSATLSILNDVISAANKADNLPELLDSILEESLSLLDFDAGGIYLVDSSTRTANVVHSKNLPPELLAEIQTVPIDKKPYDTLFIQNEPIITENYLQIAPDRSKKSGFQSMASIPLLSKGVVIGAFNIVSTRRYTISAEEKQALISIGRELGSTIERMVAEEEVKKASKNFETLFNSIDEMVFVLDMQGNILAVNNTVQKRLQYTSEELTGTNVLLLHVPERRDEALHIVQGMIAGTVDSCPVPVLAKDGTRIEVETTVTRGEWNDQEVLFGVSRDITKRKIAEEALIESEEKYRGIFENALVGIFQTAPDGRLINANEAAARMFGYTNPAEICSAGLNVGRDLYANPDDRKVAIDHLQKTGHVEIDEFKVLKCDKSSFWASAAVRAVRKPDGTISCFEGSIVDISKRKQAEEALRVSEEKFRVLTTGSSDVIGILDTDGKIQLISNNIVDISGFQPDEYEGPPALEFVHPDDRKEIEALFEQIIRGTAKSLMKEFRISRKDGGWVWVEVLGTSYLDNPVVNGIVLNMRNISERKMVELELVSAHKSLKVAHRLAHIGTFDWLIETDTVTWSEELFIIAGRDPSLSAPTFSEQTRLYTPSSWDRLNSVVTRALDTGEMYNLELELVRPDGSIRWVNTFGGVKRDWEGKVIGLHGTVQDITERKRAEKELWDSRQQFQGLVETLYDWIWEVDSNGRYTYVSPRIKGLLGYEPEELLGKTPFDIMSVEEAERVSEAFGSLLAEQKSLNAIENICLHKDGHPVIMETNGLPFYDAEGNFNGYHGTDRDITQRKELEKERDHHEQELRKFSNSLAAANKKLTLLSSITRHDINNQLTVLMGYLTLLEQKKLDPSLNTYFQKVSTAAQRISAMIQFTREYEGIGVHAPAWQDTRTLVNTAAKEAQLKKVVVKNDLPAGADIFADPLVVKVFYNLMDNAVRYGGKITNVRFSALESGYDHMIVCEDDGDGIVATDKGKIFERGFGKNTGLGLALSREILDITGITITETGEPGKGARFEMLVPKGIWQMKREDQV
jgi:PAS domain S-box-containing protein